MTMIPAPAGKFFSRIRQTALLGVALLTLSAASPTRADNVDELIELFNIQREYAAQHSECLAGAVKSLEFELQLELQSDELEIEKGDPDWALLAAIYSEYYEAICGYLSGDEIVNFYRAEFRKRFSSREIDALIEFYRTPLGKKLTAEWFEINRVFAEIQNERQSIDAFEAQQQFDLRMEDFWNYRQQKSIGHPGEQDA